MSFKKKVSFPLMKPLDPSFDANQDIIEGYKRHIKSQEEINAQLATRVKKLEAVHSCPPPSSDILSLTADNTDLQAALSEAKDIIRAQRKLIAALQADHAQIKLELLAAVQRSVSVELAAKSSTGHSINQAKVLELMESDTVRRKLPNKLKLLQQQLWASADTDTQQGNVGPETVLSLQHRIRLLERCLESSERDWAEERAELDQERELLGREHDLHDHRLTHWVKEVELKLQECQRECRSSTGRCSELSGEAFREQQRHLHERQTLLAALAKIGGAERLRQELQSMDVSSSCLSAAEEHVSSTCQARELKLLTLSLQRELRECRVLQDETQSRCDAQQSELCTLRQARELAVDAVKKERKTASEQRALAERQRVKEEQRVKLELQGLHADVANIHTDLKKLVHMIYKLTMWQADTLPPGSQQPPSPPAWLDGPRAVAGLARRLQSALEATRGRMAGIKKTTRQ